MRDSPASNGRSGLKLIGGNCVNARSGFSGQQWPEWIETFVPPISPIRARILRPAMAGVD